MSEYQAPFTEKFEQEIRELIRDELLRLEMERIRKMLGLPSDLRLSPNPERPDPST